VSRHRPETVERAAAMQRHPSNLGPEGALMAMGYAPTRQRAEEWATIAASRGARPADLTAAWQEWDALHAASVQTIGDTCLCSHGRGQHAQKVGTCWLRACGCRSFRAAQ